MEVYEVDKEYKDDSDQASDDKHDHCGCKSKKAK